MAQKIYLFLILSALSCFTRAQTSYETKVVTVIESLVPDGIGRSRMITPVESSQGAPLSPAKSTRRKDIRTKEYEETKLLNIYNEGGIRFQNIATNDALVASKLEEMLNNGWELYDVQTGLESKLASTTVGKQLLKALTNSKQQSPNDPNGIFLTRYYFRKLK